MFTVIFFFITAPYFCKAQKSCWELIFFGSLLLSFWRLFSWFLGIGSLGFNPWKPYLVWKLLQCLYLAFFPKSESPLERFLHFFFLARYAFGSNSWRHFAENRVKLFSERIKLAQKLWICAFDLDYFWMSKLEII